MTLPKDPFILFSFINTKLRDSGMTLEEFCTEHALDVQAICTALETAGFRYDENRRRFR